MKEQSSSSSKSITPRAQDFAAWYQDVVLQGDMAAGKFVVTVEMDPPKGLDTYKLIAGARLLADAQRRFERALRYAAGAASVAIGVVMAHRVGVRDGLFAATTTWTPCGGWASAW